MKNKGIGGRVLIRQVLLKITPTEGWVHAKKVYGTIVERKPEYELYYHTCSGGHTYVRKHLINSNSFNPLAIQLDNDLKDIEGNNIIIEREFNIKFLDTLPPKEKPKVTLKQYENALDVIKRYTEENK